MPRNKDGEKNRPLPRRRQLKLPKRRWHLFGALALLFSTIAAVALVFTTPAPDIDPNVNGDLALPPIPQPLASTHLDNDGEALPDLLAGDVSEGENPTALSAQPRRDALGNEIGSSNADIPPPVNTASDNQTNRSVSTGPKTILINGQPLSGGNTQLRSDLSQTGPYGLLPKKSQSGETALRAYARRTPLQANRQAVSLIIGGLGINESLTRQAIRALPSDVTLSFAAHSPSLQRWIDMARADGHEVLLEIPMESVTFNPAEPGANRTLKVGQDQTNQQHLDWLLSRGQGYIGVINFNGDKFLTRSDATAKLVNRLSTSGLGFISDGSFSTPSLPALAQSVSLPYKEGFGLIDPQPQSDLIKIELTRLGAIATAGTQPIGVGFAYPETLEAVNEWIGGLSDQSLQLMPASYSLLK